MYFGFDLTDTQVQTFLLRILHSLFILAVAIELYWSASKVDNHRLTRIFWKASVFAASFFLSRIVAGFLDNAVAFDIGWFSNLVNVVYWSIIVFKARRIRIVLSSPKNTEIRISLREDFDEVLDRLEAAKANVKRLA